MTTPTETQVDPTFLQARLKRLTNDLHTAQHEVTRLDARIESTQDQIIENLERIRGMLPESAQSLQGAELVTAAYEYLAGLNTALSADLDALGAILDSLPKEGS